MKIYILLSFLLSGVLSVAASEKPSREDVIEYFEMTKQIERLMGYSKSYVSVLKQTYPMLKDNFYNDPEFLSILNTYDKKLIDDVVLIFQNNINKSDLTEVVAFMKTELGRKFIKLGKTMAPLYLQAGIKTNLWLNQSIVPIIQRHSVE